MFCILLANLRKQVKIPYNLLNVNEEGVYRSMTQQLPAICVFLEEFDAIINNL